MKNTLLITAVILAAVGRSQAFVINMNASANFEGAQNSSGVKFNDTTNGATFLAGFFTSTGDATGTLLTDVQIGALGANSAALDAAFVELGATTSFNNFGEGLFAGTFGIAETMDAGAFPLTIAQYNSYQPNAGVYAYIKSSDGMELGVFKANDLLAPSASLNSLQNEFTINFGGTNSTAVIGSIATGQGVFAGNALQTTAVIPEPSSFGLIGLAAMAMIFRRRRNA
jgi:hypothetical protein